MEDNSTIVGSMFFWPTLAQQLKIHRWCLVKVATLGQQQYFNCWNFSVGPTLGQCQYVKNNVLPITPTITQRWLNDCLLSGNMVNKTEKVWNVQKAFFLDTIKVCWFEIKDGVFCIKHALKVPSEGTSKVCGRSLTIASMCFLSLIVWKRINFYITACHLRIIQKVYEMVFFFYIHEIISSRHLER